jgi:hypothetical protein
MRGHIAAFAGGQIKLYGRRAANVRYWQDIDANAEHVRFQG